MTRPLSLLAPSLALLLLLAGSACTRTSERAADVGAAPAVAVPEAAPRQGRGGRPVPGYNVASQGLLETEPAALSPLQERLYGAEALATHPDVAEALLRHHIEAKNEGWSEAEHERRLAAWLEAWEAAQPATAPEEAPRADP
jgi:hypothetical protein